MAIKNLSQKIILAEEYKICKDPFSKSLGLMFSKKRKDFALVLAFNEEKRISLHMFFVFYPIDVLFLNKNKRTVEIKKNFRPFTIYNSVKRAKYAVELACGIIEMSEIAHRNLPASARSKKAISEHAQKHASVFDKTKINDKIEF